MKCIIPKIVLLQAVDSTRSQDVTNAHHIVENSLIRAASFGVQS